LKGLTGAGSVNKIRPPIKHTNDLAIEVELKRLDFFADHTALKRLRRRLIFNAGPFNRQNPGHRDLDGSNNGIGIEPIP
jgi:hypothetical protein